MVFVFKGLGLTTALVDPLFIHLLGVAVFLSFVEKRQLQSLLFCVL